MPAMPKSEKEVNFRMEPTANQSINDSAPRLKAFFNKMFSANKHNREIVAENQDKLLQSIKKGEYLTRENWTAIRKITKHQFFQPYESSYDFSGSVLSFAGSFLFLYPYKFFAANLILLTIASFKPVLQIASAFYHLLSFDIRSSKKSFISAGVGLLQALTDYLLTLLKTALSFAVHVLTFITRSLTTLVTFPFDLSVPAEKEGKEGGLSGWFPDTSLTSPVRM